MTAFFRVWRFTRRTRLVSSSPTVSLAGSEWGPPNRAVCCQDPSSLRRKGSPNYPRASALSHFQLVPRRVFAFKLGALTVSEITLSHFDVRASVASLPFGQRNTTRRLSFTYRLLNRCQGRWLPARTPALCTGALACRLALTCTIRYLSRLTMLVSRVAPPRVLSRTCIPGRSRCMNRATSAHRFTAIPGRTEDMGGRTCLG